MTPPFTLDRRALLTGLAGTVAASALPAFARTPSNGGVPDRFEVRSNDGTMLVGASQGDDDAPEILFIHGLRQSRLSWEKQLADPALAGLRMVSFDLRGHGDSDKPTALEAYSEADRWAEDVATVISATGLRRPVLVGWSLGGFAVGAYLEKYGGSQIAGINLVDAVTKFSPDLLTPLSGAFNERTMSQDLAERAAAVSDFLLACFHQPPSGADLQRMLVINGMTAREVNEGLVRTTTTDLQPAFVAYEGPLLLTHGAHDRLVRVAMSESLSAMKPDSRMSIYPNSGHSPFYEEPVRYGSELSAFVAAANRG